MIYRIPDDAFNGPIGILISPGGHEIFVMPQYFPGNPGGFFRYLSLAEYHFRKPAALFPLDINHGKS